MATLPVSLFPLPYGSPPWFPSLSILSILYYAHWWLVRKVSWSALPALCKAPSQVCTLEHSMIAAELSAHTTNAAVVAAAAADWHQTAPE
jgi:hypothetical protein